MSKIFQNSIQKSLGSGEILLPIHNELLGENCVNSEKTKLRLLSIFIPVLMSAMKGTKQRKRKMRLNNKVSVVSEICVQ